MRKITVRELREKYPHPSTPRLAGYDDYCVAGALCREIGVTDQGFPNEEQLREAVLRVNPTIDWYALKDAPAEWLRSEINKVIALNDIGEFDAAWNTLALLLAWSPTRRDLNL